MKKKPAKNPGFKTCYNIHMKKNSINFVKLLKGYKSGWVGISPDHKSVLVSGATLRDAREKAKKTNQKLYFFPAEESYGNFVGQAINL